MKTFESTGVAVQIREGDSVETIAFCSDTGYAKLFVSAINLLRLIHEEKKTPGRDIYGVQNFLEHAGIIE